VRVCRKSCRTGRDTLVAILALAASCWTASLWADEPKPDGTTTWTEHLIDDTWSQAHSMAWADLYGDGHGKLTTGKRVRGHGGRAPGAGEPACLYYYRWDAAAKQFVRYPITPPDANVGTGMQICVADLTSDRRPDIAVSGKTGTWLLVNQGQ